MNLEVRNAGNEELTHEDVDRKTLLIAVIQDICVLLWR